MSLKKTLASLVLVGASVLGLAGNAKAEIIEGYSISNPGNPTQGSGYGIGPTQTFTIGATGNNNNFYLDKIKLKLHRLTTADASPAYVELIKATDKYLQKERLSIGFFNGNSLGPESTWVDISMESYTLKQGEQYRILLNAGRDGSIGMIYWEYGLSPGYPGGDASVVSLGNAFPNYVPLNGDFLFEVDGTPVPEPATLGLLALGGLGIISKRRKTN